jgi:hypothetical protein
VGKAKPFSSSAEFLKHVAQPASVAHDGEVYFYIRDYFIDVSVGVEDAGKPIILDENGLIDSSMLPEAGAVDHGTLSGLTDDDHSQYLKEKGSGGIASEIPVHTHEDTDECGTLDHGELTGLGDDDHPQYSQTSHNHDHGVLTGLGDDDHPQYAPASHGLLSSTHGDTIVESVVRGDIIVGDNSAKWKRKAKGTPSFLVGYDAVDVVAVDPETLDVDKVDGYHASDFILAAKMGTFVCTSTCTTSSTTPTDVTGMSFAVAANKTYIINIIAHVGSDTTGCAPQFSFTGPSSPTKFIWSNTWRRYVGTGDVRFDEEYMSGFGTKSTAADFRNCDIMHISAVFINGSNAGTVQLQLSSETAATNVYCYIGSGGTWNLLSATGVLKGLRGFIEAVGQMTGGIETVKEFIGVIGATAALSSSLKVTKDSLGESVMSSDISGTLTVV